MFAIKIRMNESEELVKSNKNTDISRVTFQKNGLSLSLSLSLALSLSLSQSLSLSLSENTLFWANLILQWQN